MRKEHLSDAQSQSVLDLYWNIKNKRLFKPKGFKTVFKMGVDKMEFE